MYFTTTNKLRKTIDTSHKQFKIEIKKYIIPFAIAYMHKHELLGDKVNQT